jgi:hypothetical protein
MRSIIVYKIYRNNKAVTTYKKNIFKTLALAMIAADAIAESDLKDLSDIEIRKINLCTVR